MSLGFSLVEGAVFLYDANGKALAVKDGVAIPADTPSLLLAGDDGAGTARVLGIDSSRRAAIQNQPNMDVALSTRASLAVQTDGTQRAIIRGGAKGTTPAADITSSHIDDNRQGIDTRNYGTGTNDSQQVEGLAPDGSPPVGNPVWIGGWDGTNVEGLDTVPSTGRLTATLYSPDGDPVSFPSTSSSIKNDFVKNGGNDSLLVDGSVTPVVFEYLADSTYDISLQEIKFTLVANSLPFGSGYFGGKVGGLTTGMLAQVVTHGQTVLLYNFLTNEGFINFASPGGFDWEPASKDLLYSAFLVGGGLKLEAGTSDKVIITVRDNQSSIGVYFKCFVKGNLLGA